MKDISSVEASHSHLHLGRKIKLLQMYAPLIDSGSNNSCWCSLRYSETEVSAVFHIFCCVECFWLAQIPDRVTVCNPDSGDAYTNWKADV